MIVCLCTGVTSSQFSEALVKHNGDWIMASVDTGAGLCCGGCRHFIAQLSVREASKQDDDSDAHSPGAELPAR
jgi:bacterioferritin-associated ferredoxin